MDRPPSVFERLVAHLPRKPWQLALAGLLGLLAIVVVAVAVVALALLPTLPSIQDLTDAELKVPLRVYTADGELIAEFGEEKRIPVKLETVPPQLIQAILSAEDHGFYQHHGVDVVGLLRATFYNLRTKSPSQGGSTITMQVARNFFLTPEKTYTRKLRELLLALRIERELSKEQILELYINKIFLGHRAYGFAAAAQVYYGTALDKLTLPEIAMLAGLPKAPSRDNPLSNPQNALERRNYVLRHMYSLGYIDQATLDQSLKVPLTASKHAVRYALDAPYVAEMVRQYMFQTYDEKAYAGGFHVYTTILSKHQHAAEQALRRALLDYDHRHGYRGPAAHLRLPEPLDMARLDDALKDYRIIGDLLPGVVTEVGERTASVYTQDGTVVEIDWPGLSWARRYINENAVGPAPSTAGQIVERGDVVYVEAADETNEPGGGGHRWRLGQVPQVTGAFVSLRPRDGAILALTGGFDFYHTSFNRATQAERQPGSGLKPFVYAAALEKGFTPATTVSGAPLVIEDVNLEDEWRPENYTRQFVGPTRLRKALALSLNLVSIRLVRAINPNYAADYLTRFGFDPDKLPRNLTIALGNASATPLQMVSAFAVFANGGFRIQPYFIKRIEDGRHNLLEQADPPLACADCDAAAAPAGARPQPVAASNTATPSANDKPPRVAPRVISPQIAFLMTSMLQDVIREGTATSAKVLGRKDLAGKTGTTDEYRDAWFNGFNSDIAATAWIGFDQSTPLGRGEAGGRAALPMWIDYMRVALTDSPEKRVVPPEGIVKAYVDGETGLRVAAPGPNAIEEYFIEGTENGTSIGATEPAPVNGSTASSSGSKPSTTPPPAAVQDTDKIRDKLF
ncbi:MAG: penicillin-binding protein 1A [Sulfurifustis sp.]